METLIGRLKVLCANNPCVSLSGQRTEVCKITRMPEDGEYTNDEAPLEVAKESNSRSSGRQIAHATANPNSKNIV